MTGALDLPVKTWLAVLYLGCAMIAGGAAFTAGALGFSHTITHTRVVKVEKSWGKPDDSAPANQVIVAELAARLGLTQCDLYAAKRTVVCS